MSKLKKILPIFICAVFCLQTASAQAPFSPQAAAGALSAGAALETYRPLHLRGLEIDPQSGAMNVLLDRGDAPDVSGERTQQDMRTLMGYFGQALKLPASVFWVNLRPDGEDQIIDPLLEKSAIGRIMLEADLQLKKDLARMTDPDTNHGRWYWEQLYAKAEGLFGRESSVEIPACARPWIVPGEIIVGTDQQGAYVFKATLKVMLEQDYAPDQSPEYDDPRVKDLNEYSAQLMRSRIIPLLTRKVNTDRSYAALRQVYYSLILAQWYKQQFPAQALSFTDAQGAADTSAWSKMDYFQAYKKSFQQGEYNKTKAISYSGSLVIRHYVSGGLSLGLGEKGSLGVLNIRAGLDMLKRAWRMMRPLVEIILPDALNPAVPSAKTMEELAGVSSRLNQRLKEHAFFNAPASSRTFKDYSEEELAGLWKEYKNFILKHIDAGVMPVLDDFRPFPGLEKFNRRFGRCAFDWYDREGSLTNVPILVLFDPANKIAYSVPVNTMAFQEEEVFNYDLADLLEMVNKIPQEQRDRLQLRVGWGANGGLRSFYIINGDDLLDYKGYTLNRIKTDEIYRSGVPAMALTAEKGAAEALFLTMLGDVQAYCSPALGTFTMQVTGEDGTVRTKDFTLAQLRREGKVGDYAAPLGRMTSAETILKEKIDGNSIDIEDQYGRSGKNFGSQLRRLHEHLLFNGNSEGGNYDASWWHVANVDYLGNAVDLVPHTFKSITGENFNPLDPQHILKIRSWFARDLMRVFIGAEPVPAIEWEDWGFIGSTGDTRLKEAFIKGFIRGYLPGFGDIDLQENDLALAKLNRFDPLLYIIDRNYIIRKLAAGQLAYDLHERLADAFTERLVAERENSRRYGEEAPNRVYQPIKSRQKEGVSSSRDTAARDGGRILSEAFLQLYPDENKAAQAVLEDKRKELERLAGHIRLPAHPDAKLAGRFVEFMLFGADGPEFSRDRSMELRLQAAIGRVAAVTGFVSAEGAAIDDFTAEQILRHIERGMQSITDWEQPDYERFQACYYMAVSVLAAGLNNALPGSAPAAGLNDKIDRLSGRGSPTVKLIAGIAGRMRDPDDCAALADFIGSEYAELYGLGLEAEHWDSDSFLQQLILRRDKGLIDLFADLEDSGAWLQPRLRSGLQQLFSLEHSNNSYRLKRKAAAYILRLHQIEDLSKTIGVEPEAYAHLVESISGYVAGLSGGTEVTANGLLEQLRQELINAALQALSSRVFISQLHRPQITDLDWIDEETLEQLAFVLSVYAQAVKNERYDITDWTARALAEFFALKDRQAFNEWLNSEFESNRVERPLLEAHGYSPDFISNGYARIYGVDGKQYRIAIDFDFFNQATAGEEVPSCFHPTSKTGGHMPLYHALEVNSTFMSVTDEQGRRLADAVVLLAPQGMVVQKLYTTRVRLDFDRQFFDYFAHLADDGLVPAVFWQTGEDSPGLKTALASGLGESIADTIEKRLRLEQDKVFFDNAMYYPNQRAEFFCSYRLTAEEAEDYRTPEDIARQPVSAQVEFVSSRLSKEERAEITRKLFALGLKHIDLGPVLRSIEELVFDDADGTRLDELVRGLTAKNSEDTVTIVDRTMVKAEIAAIKKEYIRAALEDSSAKELIAELEGSSDELTRQVIISKLEAKGRIAVRPLLWRLRQTIREKNFIAAPRIIAALGSLSDQRAVPELVAALNNINLPVRKEAVIALGRLRAQEALEPLCALADHDQYLRQEAVDALKRIIHGIEAEAPALSKLKALSREYSLPFELYAEFMDMFVFDQPEQVSEEESAWLAEETGIPLEQLLTIIYYRKAADMVNVLVDDGTIESGYSGDRIWLSLRVAAMLARHKPEQDILYDLEVNAALLSKARLFLPSIGTEIEVMEGLIEDDDFDAQRAGRVCSWLGVARGGDGLIEYSINPTSLSIEQVQIKDFLRQCGFVPQGFFPVHINVGVFGYDREDVFEDGTIERYIALPLSLLYAVDRRIIPDEETENYPKAPVAIEPDVEGAPGLRRLELRQNALVHSDDPSDHKGVFGVSAGAYALALRSAVCLAAGWQAYTKDAALRSPAEEKMALAFMRYTQAVAAIYAQEKYSLVDEYAGLMFDWEALDGPSIVETRSRYPALQEELFDALSGLGASVEEALGEQGLFLPGLSADTQAPGLPGPSITVERPAYATGILHDILDKAERVITDMIRQSPRVVDQALEAVGQNFAPGSAIESIVLEYHDSGFYKHTFKATVRSGREERLLLFQLKTDTRAIEGLFEAGELEMWTALQDSGLVPRFGSLVQTASVSDSTEGVSGHKRDIAVVQFIPGKTVFDMTGKEMFNYEYGWDMPGQAITPEISLACLTTMVGIFLELNRDVLKETVDFAAARCRAPFDFFQRNIVIEEGTGRAVLVDLGQEREYDGIYDYLALAIGYYLDYDQDRPHESAQALDVLARRWPQVDWHTVLTGVVQTLETRKEQVEAGITPYLKIAGILVEEKDADAVTGLIKAFLEQDKSRDSGSSRDGGTREQGPGGIDLSGVAMSGSTNSLAAAALDEQELIALLVQLRQEEMQGIETGEGLKEKLICLTK